jgi:hypothetical protein
MHYQKQKLERDLQVIQRQIAELTDIDKLHKQHSLRVFFSGCSFSGSGFRSQETKGGLQLQSGSLLPLYNIMWI